MNQQDPAHHPDPPRSSGRSPLVVSVPIVAFVIGVGVLFALYTIRARPGARFNPASTQPQAPAEFLATMHIPEFELLDQDARPVDRSIFDGRSTILAFTFTNCPTVCPVMNGNLLQLQGTLGGSAVQIVSISVDPQRDTPEVLRAHAKRLGMDPSRWRLLTGKLDVVANIISSLRMGLSSSATDTVTLPDGSTMPNIIHPAKLVLVGPDGSILDLASGLDWESVSRLGQHARAVAVSGDKTRP